MSQSTVKLNGAYAPPLTTLPLQIDNQGATARSVATLHYYIFHMTHQRRPCILRLFIRHPVKTLVIVTGIRFFHNDRKQIAPVRS